MASGTDEFLSCKTARNGRRCLLFGQGKQLSGNLSVRNRLTLPDGPARKPFQKPLARSIRCVFMGLERGNGPGCQTGTPRA